jgi:hypothetical protein
MNLHGWTVRPVRRYRRKKDGAESLYWGASRHVEGRHETVCLGMDSEADLRRELCRRLRQRIGSE